MQQDRRLRLARLLLVLAFAGIAASLGVQATAQAKPIRLGWHVPWATQGQLVMGLKYTNIPKLVAIELDFIGFSYGGPLNHAALSGKVDVLLTADQPALDRRGSPPLELFRTGRLVDRLRLRPCAGRIWSQQEKDMSHG